MNSIFDKTKDVLSTAAETTKGYASQAQQAIGKIIPGASQDHDTVREGALALLVVTSNPFLISGSQRRRSATDDRPDRPACPAVKVGAPSDQNVYYLCSLIMIFPFRFSSLFSSTISL
ncbi:unnamed protein product [Heligmosomoides polygyrus]|uniref:Uncharacterized protein n=1 Tax=Heligmosomoides polygyrus TaxID=6339 RepID=A0A3P7XAN6_HELPZ|nr:unnamed protein product [Heligmosomoides polygyrus]